MHNALACTYIRACSSAGSSKVHMRKVVLDWGLI